MLTVACVFRTPSPYAGFGLTGAHYDASWVLKLRSGIARHLKVPHRFVCLSDILIEGVDTIPLQENWPGWWSKVELFRPGLFTGPVLYFDLDVMVTGEITEMAGPWPSLVMLGDHLPQIDNSTCMWWDAGQSRYGEIYARFSADPMAAAARHQGIMSLGDQALISDTLKNQGEVPLRWQNLLPADGFVPFSMSSTFNSALAAGLPEAAKLVYCLGHPKFDGYHHLPFVRDHWRV